MPRYVDPAILEGQPLILKLQRPGNYAVWAGVEQVGRIANEPRVGNREAWVWSISGPYVPQHLQPCAGEAGTLAEAKLAFRAKFDAWLAWASALQHPVHWLEAAKRIE